MTIEVDISVTECDSDVTITDVTAFTSATDLGRFDVDVYLEDTDGHTINLEISSAVAYELWRALGKCERVKEEMAEEQAQAAVVEATADED